jgi:NTP pyrophosphatase (non-canonical NTP hydrolase)
MHIKDFQKLIEEIYFEKDNKRGIDKTFVWFTEEVGELARALRSKNYEQTSSEFADVFAWLSTLASIKNIDLEKACLKYKNGCPRCKKSHVYVKNKKMGKILPESVKNHLSNFYYFTPFIPPTFLIILGLLLFYKTEFMLEFTRFLERGVGAEWIPSEFTYQLYKIAGIIFIALGSWCLDMFVE